jgi:hypothetical protein
MLTGWQDREELYTRFGYSLDVTANRSYAAMGARDLARCASSLIRIVELDGRNANKQSAYLPVGIFAP